MGRQVRVSSAPRRSVMWARPDSLPAIAFIPCVDIRRRSGASGCCTGAPSRCPARATGRCACGISSAGGSCASWRATSRACAA